MLTALLIASGLALLIPSAVTLYRHPEWRHGEE